MGLFVRLLVGWLLPGYSGHKTEWASPKDQTAWFKDWSLAILA